MTEAKIGKGYRFVVYDLNKGFNGIYLDVTINQIEDLFTDPILLELVSELIIRLKMDNYGVAVLARGVM